MRLTFAVTLRSALVVAAIGCAASYDVRTIVAPEAQFGTMHTFRVLPVPTPRDGRTSADAYDPMVNNSIANRSLRETVTRAFEDRGYANDLVAPDLLVAVYASAHEKLDVTTWDYGYPYWPRWGWGAGARGAVREQVTEYTEGTVVVDVVRPGTRELLWRGSGTAALSKDPASDVKALSKAAEAIVAKFPRAVPAKVVATR